MVSDALNKGSISRDALKLLMMQSVVRICHEQVSIRSPPQTSLDGPVELKDRQPESKCTPSYIPPHTSHQS